MINDNMHSSSYILIDGQENILCNNNSQSILEMFFMSMDMQN
jgi:hypothetical protein